MATTFELTCGALPDNAVCIGFEGREALSTPFSFEVFVSIPDSDSLDLKDVLGANASLQIELGTPSLLDADKPPYRFYGMVAEIELLRASDKSSLYRVLLVPRLHQLALTRHSRIWTNKSIKDIVSEVLTEHGLASGEDFELRLSSEPAPEEHVSQYRESNLAFISRWMEREGWYYFFDHTDEKDKLVITDNPGAHSSLRSEAVRYAPSGTADRSARNELNDFAADRRAVSALVRIRDYDYIRPDLQVTGEKDAAQTGRAETVRYGARLFSPDQAKRIATIVAEQLKTRESAFSGTGAATRMYSGYLFDLDRHPRPELNRSYLLTSVRHIGYQPSQGEAWGAFLPLPKIQDVYRVELTAIESELQFRAPFVTPWPRINGYENAVVDGPASSPYAQIDDDGRYLVKLKYDEGTLREGKASTRIRMAQPHGGSVENFHFPLRKGTEVIVQFLGGDPDRPVITLVAPNAVTPSKVVSSNNTQNVIQSGSRNWIVAEDKQNSEWLHLYSPGGGLSSSLYLGVPRTEGGYALTSPSSPAVSEQGANAIELGPYGFQFRTEGNLELYAGANINLNAGASLQLRAQGGDFRTWSAGDWYLDVDGPAIENYNSTLDYRVKLAATRTYGADYELTVDGAVTRTYDQTLKTFVKENAQYMFLANHQETITGTHDETIDNGLYELVVGSQTTTTSTTHDVKVKSGGQKLDVVGNQTRTITGDKNESALNVNWEVGGEFKADTPSYKVDAQKQIETIHGIKFDLTGVKSDIMLGTSSSEWMGLRLAINLTAHLDAAAMRFKTTTIMDVGIHGVQFNQSPMEAGLNVVKLEIPSTKTKLTASEFHLCFKIFI